MTAVSDALHVACPACDTLNRVPAERPSEGARCGHCRAALFQGQPLLLNTARFPRHAEKSDIPLLVDFWAEWCGPCRAMAPEFERAAALLEPKLRLAKVNVDEEPALAQKFAIRSIPTLAVILHGRELGRTAGAMRASGLATWAQQFAGTVKARV